MAEGGATTQQREASGSRSVISGMSNLRCERPVYCCRMGNATRTFRHPVWLAGIALVALVVSYAVAVQDPVPEWELSLTRWINDVPEWVADVLYPIMQLGTVWAPIVVSLVILVWRRDWLLSAAMLAGGLIAWFGAKGVKRIVERDRPLTFLPDIVVREGDGTGLGFVSGHSAVAAVTAVVAMAALPRAARPVVAVLALLVGIGRIVHGVHLPADVVGGWAFGALVGLGLVAVVDRLRSRLPATAEEPVTAGEER